MPHAACLPRAFGLRAAERVLLRAERALRLGDTLRAESLARRILAHESAHLGALELLGRTLLRRGEAEATLGVAERLLALNPYDPGYHSLKGLAMRELGRYADSGGALKRDPAARPALQALRRDQAEVVADLLKSDRAFARRYTTAPVRTLRENGFFVG